MTQAVQERYARFAAEEAPGRSDVYAEWARGVAEDLDVQHVLAGIPENRRQPPLVFAVTRLLGAPSGGFESWREFLLSHADDVVSECRARRLQTNEPLRTAPLLAALSRVSGPIALLEVGASAGLCLYPDRYSYRFADARGNIRLALDPGDGPSTVVLESRVDGPLPSVRLPEVVWRAGIDLTPLDARDDRDRRWLQGLVWPGEEGREERVTAALDIVSADPPILLEGDANDRIDELAAEAPSDATLVITTPGVLVHIPAAERAALVGRIRSLPARWVTIDPPALLDVWKPSVDVASWPGFVVALDGNVCAAADPLGRWWEWCANDVGGAT